MPHYVPDRCRELRALIRLKRAELQTSFRKMKEIEQEITALSREEVDLNVGKSVLPDRAMAARSVRCGSGVVL